MVPLNTVMIALAQAKLGQLEKAKSSLVLAIELNEKKPSEPELFEIYLEKARELIELD